MLDLPLAWPELYNIVLAMKTLAVSTSRQEILDRLRKLSPETARRWGRMTCNQMICHLTDSLKGVIGERSLSPKNNPFSRTVVKWVALRAPIRWPHGVKTRPEMDQMIGGTRPVEFEKDRLELEALLDRVTRPNRDFQWSAHPIFGRMSEWEWQRWAYLHADHHLRQFGV
ncbi:MAG TPA: DUF1569 domain-containing protein [Blastocatellia bacterium]|nr:DUF1569 domain-containing protein [Blastocatellia bacterium]